jgi:hypothetical protein
LKDARLITVPDAVAIGFGFGIESGMKSGMDFPAGVYADILRQIPPKLSQNLCFRHRIAAVKVCYLPYRMSPGIGSSAAGDLNLLAQDSGQGLLQLALNGIVYACEPLPTTVAAAVIAQVKTQIPHFLLIPFWLHIRCQPKTGTFRSHHKLEHDRKHI